MVVTNEWYEMRRGSGDQREEWQGIVHRFDAIWKHRRTPSGRWKEVRKTYKGTQAERALVEEMQRRLADGFVFCGRYRLKSTASQGSKPWPAAKARPPRWLAKVPKAERDRVTALIHDAKLGHRLADILSLARPAIRFELTRSKAPSRVTTRFGGDPDVPADFAWPMHGTTPLAFVAQFDLAPLAALDLEKRLPSRGLLSVFAHLDYLADDGYAEHGRVFYFADPKALVRTRPAHTAERDGRPARIALAKPTIRLTLPGLGEQAVTSLRLTDDEEQAYDERVVLKVRLARLSPSKPGAHQLLGWSDGERPGARHELLAHIDSDGRFGFEVGDVETLRIWIPSAKLAAKDFKSSLFTLLQ